MKVHVCPFCSVVSVAPHQSQQACIQALQTEIAQTRQVLECRTERLTAGAPRRDLKPHRPCAPSDGNTEDIIRLSVRCAMDS
jgi:hypothetical protein